MYSLPVEVVQLVLERPAEQPGARDLDLLADAVLGDDPDLLVAGDVGDVARDRQAALEVAVVAGGAHDLGVDELVQVVLDLDDAGAQRLAELRAPRARRPGAWRIVSVRSSSSSWRYLPKLSTGSPLSRSRGSPRRTMGRTLMTREYTQQTARSREGRGGRCRACRGRLDRAAGRGLVLGRGRVLERGGGRRRVRARVGGRRPRRRPTARPRPASPGSRPAAPRPGCSPARRASGWRRSSRWPPAGRTDPP